MLNSNPIAQPINLDPVPLDPGANPVVNPTQEYFINRMLGNWFHIGIGSVCLFEASDLTHRAKANFRRGEISRGILHGVCGISFAAIGVWQMYEPMHKIGQDYQTIYYRVMRQNN